MKKKSVRFSATLVSALALILGTTSTTVVAQAEPVNADKTPEYAAASQALENPILSNWSTCEDEKMAEQGLECTNFVVPLDYSNLDLGTLTLPVARKPAANQDEKIGSLFTNPGGPGGEATKMAGDFAELLGDEVHQKFDVIGIAPRGVEGEELAQCSVDSSRPAVDEAVFPLTDHEIKQHFALDQSIQDACAKGPRILQHMSTADVARDMEQARKAVGDEKITYYGISYGTYVGATYAALFPNNIRALVVDGVIDPVGWATGRGNDHETEPVDERLASGIAGKEALNAAIGECQKAGKDKCAVADTIMDDWVSLKQTLRMGPAVLKDGTELRYDILFSSIMSTLYSPSSISGALDVIHRLSSDLADSKTDAGAQNPGDGEAEETRPENQQKRNLGGDESVEAYKELKSLVEKASEENPALDEDGVFGSEDGDDAYDVRYAGVMCSETLNPTTEEAFVAADDRAWGNTGGFGQLWNWQSSVCAKWPVKGSNAYQGPFNIPTSVPVLIVGNDHDPATPGLGAETYHRTLPTSRLVTVKNGFGHGALGLSKCVDDVRTDYLVRGEVPEGNVNCDPDKGLFDEE